MLSAYKHSCTCIKLYLYKQCLQLITIIRQEHFPFTHMLKIKNETQVNPFLVVRVDFY